MKPENTNPYDAPTAQERHVETGSTTKQFRALTGASVGVGISLVLLELAAGIAGGILRLAPCHSAPDFISGAMFGLMYSVVFLTEPPILFGAIVVMLFGAALGAWKFGFRKVAASSQD